MAALLNLASLPSSFTKMSFPPERMYSSLAATRSSKVPCPTQCNASYQVYNNQIISRRSANFQPSIWTYDYIQSLSAEYKEECYIEQAKVLKEEVRVMLCKVENQLHQLDFIDVLQRLGIGYYYHNEIRNLLDNIYNTDTSIKEKNLYATTLKFRLLRKHGYNISPDIFIRFQDATGNFKKCHSDDAEGMLSLYEASFHSFKDESILDDAKEFSTNFLKEYLNKHRGNHMSHLISHALELSLHWRNPRWEAQWFIIVYGRMQNMIPALLQLAKLDFNIAQSIYVEELKDASRWWTRVGLQEKLSFARDRLVENYVWTVGVNPMPDLGYFRKNMTKINSLITIIDDIYDVYGTLEELKLFTEVIDRWDLNSIDSLPDYMKICFQVLYNFVCEMAFENQRKSGIYITPYLNKVWADICKSYFIEAKWYYSGYIPSLEEYIENAWISISVPVILMHAYFLIPHSIKEEELNNFKEYPEIIRFSGIIFRLANDLGTYKRENETGDVPKSIHCYMNQTGATEAETHEYLKSLMYTTWKKMNQEVHYSHLSQSFKNTVVNLTTMALCMYQRGDGHSIQDPEMKSLIQSLVIQPILIKDRNI